MTTQQQTPHVLDPTGSDRQGEDTALRAQGPLTRVNVLGEPAWAITDPKLLKALLMDARISKDAHRHWPRFPDHTQEWPLKLWVGVRNMFTAHGENHRRLRRLVAPAFAGRRMTALTPRIEHITRELLTSIDRTPPGEPVDLRDRYAAVLPIRVIGHLMGLPDSQAPAFRRTVDSVFDTTLTTDQAAANTRDLYAILTRLVTTKRAEPGDDLTTRLIEARDTDGLGGGLTEQELLDTLLLVISAGYETTVNLIDQAITALLTHPEHLAEIRTGTLSWDDIVEETLRWKAPVPLLPMRYATTEIVLPRSQGIIRKGDAVIAAFSAANTHRALHGTTADRFDPARPHKTHLSFGHGVHACVGATLSRLEATTALRMLFARFPHLTLAVHPDELAPLPSFLSHGHRTLPVLLRPEAV
ncbi:cytochrome P450 family protein [Streptomyces albipurpureus]|uniref:Cytochrome P450 n=1 Tax=Streptomyces albipurpureus TaxID=2897419 RepID=A0ABT0UJG4_9ACTN|nr:cytochrome P450 [Streptomyces sp. CWNU-1]MCM2388792.1 cytochrome P450 [Streptomyces sp. CWNU-1]